jgi:transcriptional regulator with XRE-family HTH domain
METRLKAVRAQRQWAQQRLIVELERAARVRGLRLPERASLKTQISRWENGRTIPAEAYRRLLRDAYRLTDEELGFPPEDGGDPDGDTKCAPSASARRSRSR